LVGSIATNYADDLDYKGPLSWGFTSVKLCSKSGPSAGSLYAVAHWLRSAATQVTETFDLSTQTESLKWGVMPVYRKLRIKWMESLSLSNPKLAMTPSRLKTGLASAP
jgi:hypothetical protein